MSKFDNIKSSLDFGKFELTKNKIKDPELCAEILLSNIVGISRQSLYAHFEDELSNQEQKLYEFYILRRSKHEPLQYILGYTYFRGLKINVGPGVLIPRPETEQLVEVTLKNLNHNYNKILDLCTGSGCIACSFANEFSDLKIVATDDSEEALKYAKINVDTYNFNEKIELIQCNMSDEVYDEDFDLIISNPPYIPTNVYNGLDTEVLNFEPKLALEAGADGASFLSEIIQISKDKLKPQGIVALEFYEENLEFAKAEFEIAGFKNCKIYKDLAQKDRILIAKR